MYINPPGQAMGTMGHNGHCDCSGQWDGTDESCCGTLDTGGYTPHPGCFTEDSKILMEDGTEKKISDIELGDIVKSEIEKSTVIGIDIHKGTHTVYSINGSKYFVTAEHPFKTTEGWKAINPLKTFKTHGIESNILEIGDILITKEGTEEVKSIKVSEEKTNIVYNLKLDNEYVYYVNEYLVHNAKDIIDDPNIIDPNAPDADPNIPNIPTKPLPTGDPINIKERFQKLANIIK